MVKLLRSMYGENGGMKECGENEKGQISTQISGRCRREIPTDQSVRVRVRPNAQLAQPRLQDIMGAIYGCRGRQEESGGVGDPCSLYTALPVASGPWVASGGWPVLVTVLGR